MGDLLGVKKQKQKLLQSQALRKAKAYISIYPEDHCDTDWNNMAVKKAKAYLAEASYDREELLEKIQNDGFTKEQAVFGVELNRDSLQMQNK